jgi:hypothetical protein
MRKVILLLVLLLLPSICLADEYVLVMSKEDNVCQHMLKLYNDDLKKNGEVKYDEHREFNWIRWEEKGIQRIPASGPPSMRINAKIALFDINNDSKDEVIIYSEGSLSNSPTDDYDIFRYDDLAILNEIVDGRIYYEKRLKGFSSAQGVPINVYDLSEADIKKLLEKMKLGIEATKKRGEKDEYFVKAGNKINFLKFKNRFYITFEERSNAETLAMALDRFYREGGNEKTSRRSNEWLVEGFNDLEKYALVSEYQKDNTLKTQCLYFKKDKPAKRRAK